MPDAKVSNIVLDGVHQTFIIINNAILTVNPEILNYFI